PLTFALAAAAGTGGCSRSEKITVTPPPVLVAQSFATNLPVQIDPSPVGHVMPYSTVTVRPQIGGVLQAVHFKEGEEVKKGDLLFSIDPRLPQAALAATTAALARDKAQLENAKIQFDREKQLFGQKLVSQDAFDTSRASVDALQATVQADEAAVTNAQLNLGFCSIRAPIDGVAGALQFYPGNVVKAPDDTLVTINQIHPIFVQFGVPEQFLPEIRREMREHPLKVTASFDNMNVPPPQGKLTFIDNTVDTTTGMIQLKATFPNESGVLWPGQFVTLNLALSELTNAIVVPSQAVQTGQNGEFIYVVSPDKTAEERPVTAGVTYNGATVIRKGLQAGETVVTDGQLRLLPGVKVSIKTAEATGLSNNSTTIAE
ncbi:MAG TPA: efflux RND transporter periplasmic adaptor subunit, partial [Verrucomicrobiae bacterium]|nr:efflux RND transporter periplasmic adaptor subunit [Verrucomicrobiae bacterium]